MSHYINKCKHGKVISQCRCPGGEVTIVPCHCPDPESTIGSYIIDRLTPSMGEHAFTVSTKVTLDGVTRNVTISFNISDFKSELPGDYVGNNGKIGNKE